MTNRTPRLNVLRCSLLSGALLASSAAHAAEMIEGRLSQITHERVTIDDVRNYEIDLPTAQCFDHRGDEMTCETLAAVGYADKVRVTVSNSVVQRIDIIELQQ